MRLDPHVADADNRDKHGIAGQTLWDPDTELKRAEHLSDNLSNIFITMIFSYFMMETDVIEIIMDNL